MLTTEDYLKLDPWDALIEIINQKYFLQLFSTTTQVVQFIPGSGVDTQIRLKANRSTRGQNLLPPFVERTFRYQRLDLTEYFGSQPIVISNVRAPVSTDSLVRKLTQQTGITFTVDDFLNEIIMTDAELNDYTLLANPKSLRWVGQVRISGVSDLTALDQVVTQPNAIEQLNYAGVPETKQSAVFHLSRFDFSEYRRELLVMRAGKQVIPHKRIAAILTAVTKEPWVCQSTLSNYNIATDITQEVPQYTVVYNSVVSETWTARKNKRYVMVLQLSPTLCDNLSGHLLIHYD